MMNAGVAGMQQAGDRERNVPHALDRVQRSSAGVVQLVEELEKRLYSVLVMLPPATPGSSVSAVVPTKVQLAEQIESASSSVEAACERLNSILSRLEL